MTVYKIEFHKNVPVVEKDGAKWMFDTGCPFSYPNPMVYLNGKITEFLGIPDLRMMGMDKMGKYLLVDYSGQQIIVAEEKPEFTGKSLNFDFGFSGCPYINLSVDGHSCECYLDTGAQVSYLRNLDLRNYEHSEPVQECDVMGNLWKTETAFVPAKIADMDFSVRFGEADKNMAFQFGCDKDGVIGFDFFRKFKVLFDFSNKKIFVVD